MHICFSEIIIIGSDDGLSPGRRQVIIWINAWIMLFGTLGIHRGEIIIRATAHNDCVGKTKQNSYVRWWMNYKRLWK